jgi:hypothetical protein
MKNNKEANTRVVLDINTDIKPFSANTKAGRNLIYVSRNLEDGLGSNYLRYYAIKFQNFQS